jgi:hypothetical protein
MVDWQQIASTAKSLDGLEHDMASNIKEKNKVYSFKSYTDLPYSDDKNINYSYENSMINSSNLNNTYS